MIPSRELKKKSVLCELSRTESKQDECPEEHRGSTWPASRSGRDGATNQLPRVRSAADVCSRVKAPPTRDEVTN